MKMSPQRTLPHSVRLLACLLLPFAPLSAAAADFFVQDNFADDERFVDKPAAGSFAWLGSEATRTYSASRQGLSFAQGGPKINSHLLVYFTPADQPRVLGLGDTLTLSIRFTPTQPGNNPGGFRLGLFNSHGLRVRGDEHRTAHPHFQDGAAYDGIAAVANLASAVQAPVKLLRRAPSTDAKAALITNEIAFATAHPGTAGGNPSTLVTGIPYTARLTLDRRENGTKVEFIILDGQGSPTGIAHRQISPAFDSHSFDCFALGINNGDTSTLDAIVIHGASIRHRSGSGR